MLEMLFLGHLKSQNIKIFRGFSPDPIWGAHSAPQRLGYTVNKTISSVDDSYQTLISYLFHWTHSGWEEKYPQS